MWDASQTTTEAVPAGDPVAVSAAVRRRGGVWPALVFAACAAAVPLGYALYTGQVWEDYFITFRYSRNLVEGKGLVYNEGERVHGFTSPLGVLLPAAAYAVIGSASYEPALWVFRILSAMAFAAGGVLVWRRLGAEPRLGLPAQLAFALFYLAEAKSVAFSANGMETGFMLLFVGWGLALAGLGPEPWPARGLCWAGLVWTRPDGCIYVAAFMVLEWVFGESGRSSTPSPLTPLPQRGEGNQSFARPSSRLLGSLAKSALLSGAIYLPWFAGAWAYYGSPIPNTILAKARPQGDPDLGVLLDRMWVAFPRRAAEVFSPVYYPVIWNQPAWIGRVSMALGVFCAMYWLVPGGSRLGRGASLAFALVCVYFSYVEMAYPWYFPPAALCGLVVLADLVARAASWRLLGRPLAIAGAAGVAAFMAFLLLLTARQMRVQQTEIEEGNRVPIARWLAERVKPGETVYLEALGYIGYFSGARMADWPGLVSRRVVDLRRKQGLDYQGVVEALTPEWVVARAHQVPGTRFFLNDYVPLAEFDVRPELARYGAFYGKPYLLADANYYVFRKLPDGGAVRLDAEHQKAAAAVNAPLYPMMKTPPVHVRSSAGSRAASVRGRPVLVVMPEGEITFACEPGRRRLSGTFGLLSSAYDEATTAGVEFVVESADAHGVRTILLRRGLDPQNRDADRQPQTFEVEVPEGAADVVLRTHAAGPLGPADLPYWTAVEMR